MKRLLTLCCALHLTLLAASQSLCTGSLGDPVVNITFGSGSGNAASLPTIVPGASTTYGFTATSGVPVLPVVFDGNYTICNGIPRNDPWFAGAPDHTPGDVNGYMAFFNASSAASEFYNQTITGLCPNTTYEFASWIANALDPSVIIGQKPNITFQITRTDGTVLGSIATGDIPQTASMQWRQYGFFFTTPAGINTVVLKMVNSNPGGANFPGNDLAIDDITFRACGPTLGSSFDATTQVNSKSQCSFAPVTLFGKTTNQYTNPAFLWQVSTNGGSTWSDLAGSNTLTYTYTPTASGTFQFRMVSGEAANIGSASCRVASNSVSLTVGAVPNGHVFGNVICSGGQGQIQMLTAFGTGPFTLRLSDGVNTFTQTNVVEGVPFNIVPSPTSTTVYTLQSITDQTGCERTSGFLASTTSITVTPGPPITVSAPTTICQGDSTQLTATGAGNYQWSPANGLSNASIANPKASPAATTIYQVTGTTTGCSSTKSVTVTVRPKPTAAINPSNVTICYGDSTQLTGSGAGTYLWLPATGLSSATVASPKASPLTTTAYKLAVTNAQGCSDTAQATVTVRNPLTVTVTSSSTICAGDSTQLQATGGSIYQWSPAAGLSNAAVANPKASPATTTTYRVIISNSFGCRDAAFTTVNIKPKPTVSVAPAAAAICVGDSILLTATGLGIYAWTPAASLSDATIAAPKAGPATTTTYLVKITGANGCADSARAVVTVNARPLITMGPGGNICARDSIQLTATGGGTYQWTPAAGLDNPSASNPKAGPAASTLYQVLVSNAAGCQDSTTVQVNVKAAPTATASGGGTICARDSIALLAGGGGTYLWQPAAGLSNPASASTNASPATSITYRVIVVAANGCKDSAQVQVNVNPGPVLTTSGHTTLCRADSVQISAAGAASYAWSPAAGLSAATVAGPRASPASTTTYQVVGSTALGCTDSMLLTITVNAKPTVLVATAYSLCRGDSLQLAASGGGSYQWSPSATLMNANSANPVAFPRDTTRYSLVVTSANGCIDSAHTQVNVFRLPLLFVQHDSTLCSGTSYFVDASTLPGSTGWLWNDGSTAPAKTISAPGIYWVHTQVTGCNNPIRDSIFVDTLGRPTVSLGPDRLGCSYDEIRLSFTGTNISTHNWSTGSSQNSIVAPTTGTYSISVANRCGTAQDEVHVEIELCNDEIYFPDGFTPNGDGLNDKFRAALLPGVSVASYELLIYNRWGELVFRTTKLDEGWDGILRGKLQDGNSFVWHARYRKRAGEPEQFRKGTFVLIR